MRVSDEWSCKGGILGYQVIGYQAGNVSSVPLYGCSEALS